MDGVLGVDAGGSKCEALLAGWDGTVLGWGRCDVGDPESGRGPRGSGRTRETVVGAVRRALGEHRPRRLVISGLGGWDLPELAALLAAPTELVPVDESQPAFELAGEEAGVVVVAGTGAMVQGVTRDGRRLHLDGLGPLLGDYGSGYQIGLAALQAVARATHHPRHATALTAAVEQALGLDLAQGAGPLVGYSLDSRDRAEIAGCAVLVDQAAEAGDAVAGAILERCAASQAEVVRDVVDRLAMAAEPYKLIAAGSVAVRSRRYWRHLCAAVATFAPRFVPVRPRLPAVVGIVARVLRRRAPGSGAREALLRAAANWPRDGETHVDGG